LPEGSRIAVLRLRSLGDTVLLTPALAALHAWRPDLRVSVLLEPPFVAILEGNPAVAEVLPLRGSFQAIRAMRRRKFAVAYNQHSGPRSAILTGACGAPARVSWASRQFSFVYNVEVPAAEFFYGRTQAHTAEHAITPFYWTGLPRGPIPATRVYPQADAVAAVEQKLAARGILPGQPYAVLRPGASAFDKRWPAEHFAWLARWLREQKHLATVVNLGPGDQEISGATRGALAPEDILLDSLDVRELIALIAGAQLFVGNDSGPTHIAAALERPTVVIFGASNTVHWRPWQTSHYRLLQFAGGNPGSNPHGAAGGPCDILGITRESVRDACDSLLDETRSHSV
jgi:heptosyltransferase III